MVNFFNSAPKPTEGVWDTNTVTMQQPISPAAPSTNQKVVDEQPSQQESMQLRGGGSKGGICCGCCAALACFECCEICC